MNSRSDPFYRPLWRRIAIVAVCAIWSAIEWVNNQPFWGTITLAATCYAIWQFLYLYKPEDETPDHGGPDPEE